MKHPILPQTGLLLLATLSVSADEFHWNKTSGDGNWNNASCWTDANGNAVSSWPGENSTTDVAVFHGMGMAGHVFIKGDLDLACVRFEDGNQTFVHPAGKHFHADRFEFSDHATFGYVTDDYSGFSAPSDFTIGNRDDLLVGGSLFRAAMNYQNQSIPNWASRRALSIDTNGKLLTNQGNCEGNYEVKQDQTYGGLYGLRYGNWGDFRSIEFKGSWTLTLPGGHIAAMTKYGGVGKPSSAAQGTVSTGDERLYFWPTHVANEIRTNYFRAKIDAPALLQCGYGCTVLIDDHSSETCAYDVTAGVLQLGGEIYVDNTTTVESWTCALGTGPVDVRWSGTLHVICADALHRKANLRIHSFRERSLDKNATDVIYGQVRMDADGTVRALYIDGKPMPSGTYGSSDSTATFKRDDIFSGTGVLTVRLCDHDGTFLYFR